MTGSRTVAFSVAMLALALTHCGEKQPAHGSTDVRMAPASRVVEHDGRGNPVPASNELDDRQIAMALDAFHSAVLDQARTVFPKTKDDAVKRFAQTLLAEHQRAKQEDMSLFVELRLGRKESSLATDIGVESGKTLFAMREAEGARLDRVFVAAQVALQDGFLRALDDRLIRSAGEPRLKKRLEELRPHVELHLEMARGLERALNSP